MGKQRNICKSNNEMNTEFIPYKFAIKLKELGFDEPCIAYYTYTTERLSGVHNTENNVNIDTVRQTDLYENYTLAPLWQQAFRWFRDKHKLLALPMNIGGDWKHIYDVFIYNLDKDKEYEYPQMICESYEVAEYECLKLLIEILEERKNKKRYVGVVSKNIRDFLDWKIEKGFDKINPYNMSRKFEVDNTFYICLSQPDHVRGYHLDEVISTSNAKMNRQYYDIIDSCEPALKKS